MGIPDIDSGIYVPRAGTPDPDPLVKFYEDSYRSLGGEVIYNNPC